MVFKKSSAKLMDTNRNRRIQSRLRVLSQRRRNEQLREEKRKAQEPVLKRGMRITVTKKVLLNKNGNGTGIHNRISPPSSEHMRKIRAMRKVYNRQMPVLQCSTCAFATSCPQFKAGFECAFLPFMHAHTIENERDLMEEMKNLCEASLTRVHRQAMMETLTGGMPSLETSEAFNLAFMQLKACREAMIETDTATVSVDTEDGTIIGRLFGGLDKLVEHTTEAQESPINVIPVADRVDTDRRVESPKTSEVDLELIREHTRDELEHITGSRRPRRPAEKGMQLVHVGNIKTV